MAHQEKKSKKKELVGIDSSTKQLGNVPFMLFSIHSKAHHAPITYFKEKLKYELKLNTPNQDRTQ